MKQTILSMALVCAASGGALAHDTSATYIANEGVLVTNGETKIMFDPLPLSGFGTYLEPSADTIAQMMEGYGPFSGVDVVFISHAHRDHFSAAKTLALMAAQQGIKLVVPSQAVDMMREDGAWDDALLPRITALDMTREDAPQAIIVGDITATAVRIPHSGWPRARTEVQNMVYRVTLNTEDAGDATVMHMGDADVRRSHFSRHKDHWQAVETDMGFPPYWFLTSDEGKAILRAINIKDAVGVHVPADVPANLPRSLEDYFSKPGETRVIGKGHEHD